jgi:tetratricopeptide (TPR) repeat protein
VGQVVVRLEYENLLIALRLALKAQESIGGLYFAMSEYLEMMQETQHGLELSQMTWVGLQTYPDELQAGLLGMEIASVLHYLANCHLRLKQYGHAENAYQQALAFLQKNIASDADDIGKRCAALHHQLSRLAEEQRKWEEAEQYYEQALQMKIESQERYSQALTYHQLGMVAEEQKEWVQARSYLLQALELFVEYDDAYYTSVTLRNLARLWRDSGDTELPAVIAPILKWMKDEVEQELRRMLGDGDA